MNIVNKHDIAIYVRNQFPSAYEEGGDNFIAFVEAYYEYLDQNYFQNRTMLESIDIDTTLAEFVYNFKETYLKDFPYVAATSKEFMIKNILDFYTSKGSILSTELLIRMLFGDESKIFLPSLDVLKPSDSKWVEPEYIEVFRSDRTVGFLNTEITGSKSKAKAIVEGIVTKRVEGKYIDIVYLSNVRGSFVKNEYVTNDGRLKDAPNVIGSLTTVIIQNGGRNNKVGDTFEVIGAGGSRGKVRVAETVGATGRVDFSIEDGGYGYTTTSDTDVYISDAILMLKNPDLVYRKFDDIKQDMETLNLISYDNISTGVEIGHFMTGVNPSGLTIANGVISGFTNNGDGTGQVKLLIQSGTFDDQRSLGFTGDTAPFSVGDDIEEDSLATIEISSPTVTLEVGQRIEQAAEINMSAKTGTLTVTTGATSFTEGEVITLFDISGERVIQGEILRIMNATTIKLVKVISFKEPRTFTVGGSIYGTTSASTAIVSAYAPGPNNTIYTDKVSGVITGVSGATVTLNKVWGELISARTASIYENETATSPIGGLLVNAVNYTERGAKAIVSSVSPTRITAQDIKGEFNVGRVVKVLRNKNTRVITDVLNEGATDVRLNGVVSANAVISSVANTTASGTVIGQNTSSIGVWGNSHPFISSGDINIPNTLREIFSLTSTLDNVVTIVTRVAHGYAVGQAINLNIELQQEGEVKYIHGVYTILSISNTQNFTIQVEPSYANIIRQGDYSFFDATVERTLYVGATVVRNDGPNITINVDDVATGQDAHFKVGSLEGEETVFINTDIIGSNNIVDVPYLNIRADASDSGVGYVGAVKIVNGGTSYVNGAVLAFSGGGYGNGSPEIVASGFITTSATGVIVDVNMTQVGQGYHLNPTITLPVTTGTAATLEPLMEYGYGFPKMPEGGIENYLEDMWTSKEMTIGKISSLSEINPGSNYNANPYVLVYNKYIAGFQRSERVYITLDGSAASYMIGETVYQNIPGDGGSIVTTKGYVSGVQGDVLYLKKLSFNTSFVRGFGLIGQTSGSSRNVLSVEDLSGGKVLGDNAVIPAIAIAANGIATQLEVIDSGFGYNDNEPVTLYDPLKPFIMTGVTGVAKHGKSEGSWDSTVSHLDGNSKIHDNDYYQEFSYEVVTGKSLDKYEDLLKNIVHVAGTKLFGKVEKRNYVDVSVKPRNSALGNWSNFGNAYMRLVQALYSDGESGEIFWPDLSNWYRDINGVVPVTGTGQPVLSWRSSNKITNSKRKNLISWSNDFTGDDWEIVGLNYDRFTEMTTLDLTDGNHYYKKNVFTKNEGPYTFSAYIKTTDHQRITVLFDGNINSGYVTFNLHDNSIAATSGGYAGRVIVELNGVKRIVVTNPNDKATNKNTSFNVYVIFNSETGHGQQSYLPTVATSTELVDVQLEVGTTLTPYQDVTHGDEWDGMNFYQPKGGEYSLISATMPANGIKNIFEGSDEIRASNWEKRNSIVIVGENMDGQPAHKWSDTYDRDVAKEHSLVITLPNKKVDNFGFVLKPNPTTRYAAISYGTTYAVFDLNMATNVYNGFDEYTVHALEDGSVVIGVKFDSNSIKYTSELTTNKVRIIMMNGSNYTTNTKYVGDGNKYLGILRGYIGYTGFEADYTIGLQKNRNRYDITQVGIENVWYLNKDDTSCRFVGKFYGDVTIYTAIAGTDGILFEETEPYNDIYYRPNINQMYDILGGIISVVTLDRPFTPTEKEMLIEYFQKGGAGGVITFDETITGLDNFEVDNTLELNEPTNEITITKNAVDGYMIMDVQDGIYTIEFDYDIVRGIDKFEIYDMDSVISYNSKLIESIPTNVESGDVKTTHRFENGKLAIKFRGNENNIAKLSNFTLNRYDIV